MDGIEELMAEIDDVERGVATLLPEPDPEVLFCPVISVDDHVLEPPDIFSSRVPAEFRERVPQLVESANGLPLWDIEGQRLPITVVDGAAGRPKSEWNLAPQRYDEFRPGVADAHARLGDMDVCGVWAQLGFPSMTWGFAGTKFATMSDTDAGLAAVRAYNDWMIDEWCAADLDRYIPCQLTWLRDPQLAAAEVRRNAARGFKALSFPENPEPNGFASLYSGEWDAVFAACEETGTVVNLHVGSSGSISRPSRDSPHEVVSALFPLNGIAAVVDWIFAKIPIRFPNLRIALSEAGATWVPMVAERLRRAYRGLDVTRTWRPEYPEPVDLLRSFWFCSIEDPAAFRMLDVIDEDHLMVETDYPHFDTTWPTSQALLRDELAGLPAELVHKVCYRNAAALYRHPEPPASWIARAEVPARPAA